MCGVHGRYDAPLRASATASTMLNAMVLHSRVVLEATAAISARRVQMRTIGAWSALDGLSAGWSRVRGSCAWFQPSASRSSGSARGSDAATVRDRRARVRRRGSSTRGHCRTRPSRASDTRAPASLDRRCADQAKEDRKILPELDVSEDREPEGVASRSPRWYLVRKA